MRNKVKNFYKFLFLMLGLVTVLNYQALADGSPKKLLAEARLLLQEYKDTEALRKYEEVLKIDSVNYEALCKMSLLSSRIGHRYHDELTKLKLYTDSKMYAEKALEINPADDDANFLMAQAMINVSNVSGLKERIAITKDVKTYLDAALKDNPEHAEAWHLMGRWHYKVANFNFAEATAANLLLGGIPEGASNAKAIEAMNLAIKHKPGNLTYYYDLALIYKHVKEYEACEETLRCALDIPLFTSEELELSRRCKTLLAQVSR